MELATIHGVHAVRADFTVCYITDCMTVGVNAVLINVTLIANIEGATIDVTIYLGVAANSEVLGNRGTTAYGQILGNI